MKKRPESAFWEFLRDRLAGKWSASRHEDLVGAGVPDVSYGYLGLNGWIELKVLKSWPVRPDTIVKVRHLKPAQTAFLVSRSKHSGGCFMLFKIDNDILLFDKTVLKKIGKIKKAEMLLSACYVSSMNQFDSAEFLDKLNSSY